MLSSHGLRRGSHIHPALISRHSLWREKRKERREGGKGKKNNRRIHVPLTQKMRSQIFVFEEGKEI